MLPPTRFKNVALCAITCPFTCIRVYTYAMQNCSYEIAHKNVTHEICERVHKNVFYEIREPSLMNLPLEFCPLRQVGSFAQQRIACGKRFCFCFITLHALYTFII